jgi:hypothetical protein
MVFIGIKPNEINVFRSNNINSNEDLMFLITLGIFLDIYLYGFAALFYDYSVHQYSLCRAIQFIDYVRLFLFSFSVFSSIITTDLILVKMEDGFNIMKFVWSNVNSINNIRVNNVANHFRVYCEDEVQDITRIPYCSSNQLTEAKEVLQRMYYSLLRNIGQSNSS